MFAQACKSLVIFFGTRDEEYPHKIEENLDNRLAKPSARVNMRFSGSKNIMAGLEIVVRCIKILSRSRTILQDFTPMQRPPEPRWACPDSRKDPLQRGGLPR